MKHIVSQCSALHFSGLMTIGRHGYDLTLGPNPDFQVLKSVFELHCNVCACYVFWANCTYMRGCYDHNSGYEKK